MYRSQVRDSVIEALLQKVAKRDYGKYLPKLVLKHVRGFSGEPITFDFPVTAVIGPNGGGKTTVLGAAACAYKDIAPRRFFAKSGSFDETMQNWEIEYDLVDRTLNSKDVVHRTASFKNLKWNRDALERPVMLFGVARTVPANERTELLKCASNRFTVAVDRIEDISDTVRTAVSAILGKDITGFRRLRLDAQGRVSLLTGKTSTGSGYSEFHFGAGESSVIRMVSQIETAEENSLILIEEIENGLHPIACIRMVEYLVEAAQRKRLQSVFTTHSNDALLPLPSKAVWVATQDRIFQGKLDIHSLRAITGQINAMLAIFVEDTFARTWVEAVLRHAGGVAIDHIQVHAMEGDGTAVQFNRYHNMNPASSIPSVCVIDGDSSQMESSTDGVFRLPGQVPELHVVGQVMDQWSAYGGKLAVALLQRFEHADAVKKTIETVRLGNRDHHLLFAQIGERLGLIPEATVAAAFCNIWAQAYPMECMSFAAQFADKLPKEMTQPR